MAPNGRKVLVPDGPRKKHRTRTVNKGRPPPIETGDNVATEQSKIVPIDLGKLAPWQLQMLQQMNVLPPESQAILANAAAEARPTPALHERGPGSVSPMTASQFGLFTPPSPFTLCSPLPTPGQLFAFGEGGDTPLTPGQSQSPC
jgi:hypothetical protein